MAFPWHLDLENPFFFTTLKSSPKAWVTKQTLLKGGVTILNILTIRPVGIGIAGKMFQSTLLTSKNPQKFNLIFRIEISLHLGVPNTKVLLHLDIPNNKILLHFIVPDNQILLHIGVPDNCSMNNSSRPWLGH